MEVNIVYDGAKERVSKSGNTYLEIYVREIMNDGEADFQQRVYRSFEDSVMQKCKHLKKGTALVAELEIRDALVTNISTELL